MQKRIVTGKVYWADGAVAPGQNILFDLEEGALAGADFVLPRQAMATTDVNGNFSVELWCNDEAQPAVLWVATFPTGEKVRFSLSAGTGSVALSSLLPYPAELSPVDDEAWGRRKRAVRFYSLFRPQLVVANLTLAAGSASVSAPAGTFGVQYFGYGEEAPFTEVLTASVDTANLIWTFATGKVFYAPAPAVETSVKVIWRKAHLGDELSRSFPTIPEADLHIVDLLAEAEEAEEQQAAVEMGLSSYTIGNTTVKWGQQGGANPTGTTRAQRLRARAVALLEGPFASWG